MVAISARAWAGGDIQVHKPPRLGPEQVQRAQSRPRWQRAPTGDRADFLM